MSRRHRVAATAALITGLFAAGCGSSSSSSSSTASSSSAQAAGGGGSVSFTGDVSGNWSKAGEASESTCGATEVIIHIQGPGSGDEGNLHVKSDGSVWLDAEKYGDFTSTTGGTFHASQGFDVNADLATARGKHAHVSGSLSC